MSLSARCSDFLDRYNPLKGTTDLLADFFERHPTAYKITLVINHLFRAGVMVGAMYIPGVPRIPAIAVCLIGSLFYRLTVEKNCAYKFALPAFVGAVSFMLAIDATIACIHGVAFSSIPIGILTVASFLPLPLYGTYVLLSVHHDVEKNFGRLPQPSKKEIAPQCHCEAKIL